MIILLLFLQKQNLGYCDGGLWDVSAPGVGSFLYHRSFHGSIKVKFWLLAVCRNGSGGVADRGALRRAPGAGDHCDCCARCQVYVPGRG
jgi:hypothetical protein